MQRYIEQLIADLKAAKLNAPIEPEIGDSYKEFEKYMLEIENAPQKKSSDLFGISIEQLPPVEKLNNNQMQLLINAIFELFNSFGISIYTNDKMPIEFIYNLVRNIFDREIPVMPGWTIDFCSGWCPECEIVDYCDAKDETWAPEELELERKKSELLK